MSPRSQTTVIDFLLALNREPTATFHEERIYTVIFEILRPLVESGSVVGRFDRFGNLLVSYRPEQAKHELALVAHTDHPAFEVQAVDETTVTLKVLGGVPLKLLQGGSIRLPESGDARLTVSAIDEDKKLVTATVAEGAVTAEAVGTPAVHDLPPAEVDGDLVKAPVIDDFVGCAIALATLVRAVEEHLPTAVTLLLTRAEEIGFVGAAAAIEARTLNEDAVVLSLEASSVMPEVPSGEGPVIREGDRGYLFDANVTDLLAQAAGRLRNRGLKVQQARMTGGVCEGSLFHCHGFAAGGMAIPLLNYHNGGDGRIDREAVATEDVVTAVELLTETLKLLPESSYLSRGRLRQKIAERLLPATGRLRDDRFFNSFLDSPETSMFLKRYGSS